MRINSETKPKTDERTINLVVLAQNIFFYSSLFFFFFLK